MIGKFKSFIISQCFLKFNNLREGLVCKTAAEFNQFIRKPSQWWCHADDDTYFNIKELYKLLALYDSTKYWYIGKISTSRPITISIDNVC
jgi:hypothetical protein